MRIVTFKVNERLLEELDRYAMIKGLTRSAVIRKAIIRLIKEEEERPRYRVVRKIVLT